MIPRQEQERLLQITAATLLGLKLVLPSELHAALKKDTGEYYVISIQNEKDYATAHIPGAARIDFDPATPQTAAALLPRDKKIVVTCNNGQESDRATLLFRLLGYDAYSLMCGIMGWNHNTALPGHFSGETTGPVETGNNRPYRSPLLAENYPDMPLTESDNAFILEKNAAYVAQGRPFTISAQELLKEQDTAFIISMQLPDDYAKGHILGAVNIPLTAFFAAEKTLLDLPADKKIIVSCYIGQASAIGALLLNMLGYEAYNLSWGLAGWNMAAMEIPPFLTHDPAFPVATGA